jgi:hypothetical protein
LSASIILGIFRGGEQLSKLQVSETNDFLLSDGKRFFYLADTVWSAFSNAQLDEWAEYLDYRRVQNFNVLQISILPILHDASESQLALVPFEENDDGSWNFDKPSKTFFQRAETMVQMAKDRGFTVALVVLWCNYVPDTWASQRVVGYTLPYDKLAKYSLFIAETFGKYEPVFLISGDTRFETQRVVDYYATILNTIKQTCPDCLTALHLAPDEDLPDVFVKSSDLDFYMYQAGHHVEQQHFPYKLARDFYGKPVKRPIIDGEPCYEGHGHGFRYGRYAEFDIRKATWQSLLSGAKAGITYGAHGVWSWHRNTVAFTSEDFSGKPYEWQTALRFKGAWDVSFARWVFEVYNLFDIEPNNDILVNDTQEIRVSTGHSKVAIYSPYGTDIRLAADMSHLKFTLIDLNSRNFTLPIVGFDDGHTVIKMHSFNHDSLVIGIGG